MAHVTSPAPAAFDAAAAEYEATRRRLVPCYDALYGVPVEALALAGTPLRRILDLGAGTGLLARRVAAAYPEARLTLADGAPAMLDRARAAFGDGADYVVGDLDGELPPGPWEAVISATAIHHLDDAGKQRLFARVHNELAPGGVFVNAEQVSGPTALFDDTYHAWHERESRARGATDADWAGYLSRRPIERWASMERQLGWLRDAGFADSDVLFKHHGFAVFVARRAG